MLSILDRYILSHFVKAYLIVVVVVLGLFVIMDLPNRIKKVKKFGCGRKVEAGALICHRCTTPIPKGHRYCPKPNSKQLLVTHYASTTPLIYIQMAPFLTVLAGMLTIAFLQQRNELVPMRAAGISPTRIVAPLIILAGCLCLITWTIQEKLIPNLHSLVQKTGLVGKNTQKYPSPLPDSHGGYLLVDRFDATTKTIYSVVYQRLDEQYNEVYEVQATSAVWNETLNGWQLNYGHILTSESLQSDEITPLNFGEHGPILKTSIIPRDIYEATQAIHALSSQDLKEQAQRLPHDKMRMDVVLESRIAYPFAGLVLLVLGLPFVLDDQGNTWVGAFACMVICGLYYVATFILGDIAKVGVIQPLLAAWLPNIVFSSLAVYLFRSKVH